METHVLPDADAVALAAARWLTQQAQAALAARGRFVVALSGGRTPWVMLRHWRQADLAWTQVHVLQVDERFAPLGHNDRNLTHLLAAVRPDGNGTQPCIHAMPVEVQDLEQAALQYADTLGNVAGEPPIIDAVQLGLGADGHTASLLPGDALLDADASVAVGVSMPYQGWQRMSLTYAVLNRARRVLWVVTGAEKQAALQRLQAGDTTIPAGRVARENAVLFADRAAAPDA